MAGLAVGLLVAVLEPQDFDMLIEMCGGRVVTGCMSCMCFLKSCGGKGGSKKNRPLLKTFGYLRCQARVLER